MKRKAFKISKSRQVCILHSVFIISCLSCVWLLQSYKAVHTHIHTRSNNKWAQQNVLCRVVTPSTRHFINCFANWRRAQPANMFMADTLLHCLHATVLPNPNSSTFQDIVTENYEHGCVVDLVKHQVIQSLKELTPTPQLLSGIVQQISLFGNKCRSFLIIVKPL